MCFIVIFGVFIFLQSNLKVEIDRIDRSNKTNDIILSTLTRSYNVSYIPRKKSGINSLGYLCIITFSSQNCMGFLCSHESLYKIFHKTRDKMYEWKIKWTL